MDLCRQNDVSGFLYIVWTYHGSASTPHKEQVSFNRQYQYHSPEWYSFYQRWIYTDIITQILQFTLGFILGVVYSMGLDKDIVTYIIISYKAFSLPRNPLSSDYSSPYPSNHRLLISVPLPFPEGPMLSCYHWVWLFGTLWTAACQAPLSTGILQARILEWLPVAMPSSRGSSEPRDQTQVSHIAGRFFIVWTTREAQSYRMYPF